MLFSSNNFCFEEQIIQIVRILCSISFTWFIQFLNWFGSSFQNCQLISVHLIIWQSIIQIYEINNIILQNSKGEINLIFRNVGFYTNPACISCAYSNFRRNFWAIIFPSKDKKFKSCTFDACSAFSKKNCLQFDVFFSLG